MLLIFVMVAEHGYNSNHSFEQLLKKIYDKFLLELLSNSEIPLRNQPNKILVTQIHLIEILDSY